MHDVRYHLGRESIIGSKSYATLDEAADAIRREMGWTEIHLSDWFPWSEVAIPTYAAYATKEERDAGGDYANAPWIYEF